MSLHKIPRDTHALRVAALQGDPKAFAVRLVALAHALAGPFLLEARWQAAEIARRSASPEAGMLAAAFELQKLLADFPQGREALVEFGLDPVLQQLEGE